jgi:hypothetical protein
MSPETQRMKRNIGPTMVRWGTKYMMHPSKDVSATAMHLKSYKY